MYRVLESVSVIWINGCNKRDGRKACENQSNQIIPLL